MSQWRVCVAVAINVCTVLPRSDFQQIYIWHHCCWLQCAFVPFSPLHLPNDAASMHSNTGTAYDGCLERERNKLEKGWNFIRVFFSFLYFVPIYCDTYFIWQTPTYVFVVARHARWRLRTGTHETPLWSRRDCFSISSTIAVYEFFVGLWTVVWRYDLQFDFHVSLNILTKKEESRRYTGLLDFMGIQNWLNVIHVPYEVVFDCVGKMYTKLENVVTWESGQNIPLLWYFEYVPLDGEKMPTASDTTTNGDDVECNAPLEGCTHK